MSLIESTQKFICSDQGREYCLNRGFPVPAPVHMHLAPGLDFQQFEIMLAPENLGALAMNQNNKN